jgi:hypothetical protein
MDKKKAIELIKSQVLGCLDPNTEEELRVYAATGDDFPFEELGQYQNLSALLPLNLTLEVPEVAVKNNVAERLYELKSELEATKIVEEEIVIEEKTSDAFTIDENKLAEENLVEEEVSFDEELKIEESSAMEVIEEAKVHPPIEEIKKEKKLKDIVDKEDFEKRTREYISSYYDSIIKDLNNQSKKTLFISIAAAVLALISIALHFAL